MLLEQLPTLMALEAVLRSNSSYTNTTQKATESILLLKEKQVAQFTHRITMYTKKPRGHKAPSSLRLADLVLPILHSSTTFIIELTWINRSITQTITQVGNKQQAACNGFLLLLLEKSKQ